MGDTYITTPNTKKTIDSLWRLSKIILDTLDFKDVVSKIVDSVLLELGYLELGYEIVVLCLLDEKQNALQRISISHTTKAKRALELTPIPFENILIPLDYKENSLIRAIDRMEPQVVNEWTEILQPSFSAQDAITIQKNLGITTSLVYPVISRGKAIGAIIFSMSKDAAQVTEDEKDLIKSYSDIVGLAVQNSRLYTQLKVTQASELAKANELLKLKDEFVFIATHDLKTPVTAIDGYISLIEEEKPKFSEDIQDNFKAVKEASERLKQLVNDLLQVARGEAGTIKVSLESIDIRTIIEQVMREVKPSADNYKVNLETSIDPAANMVMADSEKLAEVFENLLSNAIKFSKPNGVVKVSTIRENNMLSVSVIDSGHGIPQGEQGKVFEKFFKYRGDSTAQIPGTGLGLFVVRMLVEKMNGTISFVSEEEKGTTFTFTLPLSG